MVCIHCFSETTHFLIGPIKMNIKYKCVTLLLLASAFHEKLPTYYKTF